MTVAISRYDCTRQGTGHVRARGASTEGPSQGSHPKAARPEGAAARARGDETGESSVIKTEAFCAQKSITGGEETSHRTEMFAGHTPDKGLPSRLHKEPRQLHDGETDKPTEKRATDLD